MAAAAARSKTTFYVPKRSHSAIIGRSGQTVRDLQKKYNAQIAIPKPDQDTSAIDVTAAATDIEAVRQEFEKLLGFQVNEDPLQRVLLNIPSEEMGMIIGRQGSVIRQLQQETNCSIYVPRSGDASPYVEVEGTSDAVTYALESIANILGYEPERAAKGAAPPASAPRENKSRSNGPRTNGGPRSNGSSRPKKLNVGSPLDLSKPINEALFYPDTDETDGLSFDRFLAYLGSAKSTLDICVFTITDDRVVGVIKDLLANGVKIRLITDNDTSEQKGSDIQDLANLGIPTKVDTTEYHMHHKFAVADSKLLISGSFNWTWSASKNNQENQVITNFAGLVQQFQTQFNKMWADPQFVAVPPK